MARRTPMLCVALMLCATVANAQLSWVPNPAKDKLFYQLGKSFNIQTDVKTGVNAYVVDGENTPASVVQAMLARGLKPVCYFSAGSSERYRTDVASLPAEAVGSVLDGWPDENWLDIRHQAVRDLAASRIAACKAKGFVAVDPDNVDGYTNESGFPLTAEDQLAYNKFLAATAHAKGLAIGLKNAIDQIPALVEHFDFAVNEQCFQYNECDAYSAFVSAKKPVYNIEYSGSTSTFLSRTCPKAKKLGIQSSKNRLALDATWTPCP